MLIVVILLGVVGCFGGWFYWMLKKWGDAPLLEHEQECTAYWKKMYKEECEEHRKCRKELLDLRVKQITERAKPPVVEESPQPTNQDGPEYYLYEENGETKAAIRGTADYAAIERSIRRGK